MKKTVYVFRHGETDWNKARKLQGNTDIPLNDTGRDQALDLARRLKRLDIELIFSSDLVRAVDTARTAARWTGSPVFLLPGMRETNLGKAEGLTFDEVQTKISETAFQRWLSIKDEDKHYSFPDGESKDDHRRRLFQAMEWGLTTFKAKTVAFSTHGGSMRRILHHIRTDLKEPVLFPNCAVYKFEHDLQTKTWKHIEET